MNKKLKVFFSLSVLLNLLLVGMFLGGVMGGFAKHHASGSHSNPHSGYDHHSAKMEKRLAGIFAVLPADKTESFKQRLNELQELKRTDKVQMRSARKNILQVFEQEPFDQVAYQKAVKELNQLHQKQMDVRINLMSDIAQYLSPKERKKLSHLIMPNKGRK